MSMLHSVRRAPDSGGKKPGLRKPGAAPLFAPSEQARGGCSCGGSCPRCRTAGAEARPLRVSEPHDADERSADAVADRVMSGRHASVEGRASPRGVQRSARAPSRAHAPAAIATGLRSPSRPLDTAARGFMESRFQRDFGEVRVHTGHEAADSASEMRADAYTFGSDIVFGNDRYQPSTSSGLRLIAHELAHVVQQATGPGPATSGVVQRQQQQQAQPQQQQPPPPPPLAIKDALSSGTPGANERQAAASTLITCCAQPLGTLHAMPLTLTPLANGVSTSLHFIAQGAPLPAGDRCHCDDYHIIQVVTTSHPPQGRAASGYVDNGGHSTPFYASSGFMARHGTFAIPRGFPDAGRQLQTTESIYDAPTRATTGTAAGRNTDIHWAAESCVACVRNNDVDRILGCVTYGFNRNYNTKSNQYDAATPVSPGSNGIASSHFINTLRSDPTTTSYQFQPAPRFIECSNAGDFPEPKGDTRVA
jgi:hypothetical protein